MPGFTAEVALSSASVTVYWTTPDEVVPTVSTAITCAASSSFGSAETVTVAGWPSRIFAASLSLKDAVTCRPCSPTSHEPG